MVLAAAVSAADVLHAGLGGPKNTALLATNTEQGSGLLGYVMDAGIENFLFLVVMANIIWFVVKNIYTYLKDERVYWAGIARIESDSPSDTPEEAERFFEENEFRELGLFEKADVYHKGRAGAWDPQRGKGKRQEYIRARNSSKRNPKR